MHSTRIPANHYKCRLPNLLDKRSTSNWQHCVYYEKKWATLYCNYYHFIFLKDIISVLYVKNYTFSAWAIL